MTAPALVIQGSLVDAKNVSVHKCIRLSIDVPAELGAQIVKTFGWPTMAEPVAVAVARLNGVTEAAEPAEPAEKWKPEHQHPAKACALICQKETFWHFIRFTARERCESTEEAATYVRRKCGVNTRADFATNPVALRKWRALEDTYAAWLSKAA